MFAEHEKDIERVKRAESAGEIGGGGLRFCREMRKTKCGEGKGT